MAFHPDDPDYLLVGNDGGVYESLDQGVTWRYMANMPITQFYKVTVDNDEPFYNVYGGAQDNSTIGGPHRTDNNVGIRNSDWNLILGADGHQPMADPTNPNIVYANWQEGNLTRYDRATGESVYIRPQPLEGEVEERYKLGRTDPHQPARSGDPLLCELPGLEKRRPRRFVAGRIRRPHAQRRPPAATSDGPPLEF